MAKGERRAANLTAEQIHRIQVLREQGLGPSLIAKRMSIHVNSVHRALERGVGPKASQRLEVKEVHRVAVLGSREAFREFVAAKRRPGAILLRSQDILKLDDQEFVHVSRMEQTRGLVFQQMTVLRGADPALVNQMAVRVAAVLA